MDTRYERTPADVKDVIKHAKLHESELTDITQTLRFTLDNTNSENLKILQLDQHVLDELVVGGTVTFKGARNDSAVLCTSTKTYEVKEAETSNSLLLVPGLLWAKETKEDNDLNKSNESDKHSSPDNSLNISDDSDKSTKTSRNCQHKDILKVFYNYFEIRPCKPKLKKLNEILQFTAYSGPEKEYAVDKSLLFSFADLQDMIQGSDAELKQGLFDLKAMEIDGYYRVLMFEYEFRVLSQMLDLIEENSWPLDRVSRNETVDTLSNITPPVILSNLFDFYTIKTHFINDEQLYEYDESKICRIFAQYILKDAGKFNYNEFVEVWKCSVPEGMKADINMLKGLALVDLQSTPQVIWAFNESKLPDNINERFRVLFQTKEKWTVDDIAPYIQEFVTDKLNVNALLTKYARGSNHDGSRYYSAKHSK